MNEVNDQTEKMFHPAGKAKIRNNSHYRRMRSIKLGITYSILIIVAIYAVFPIYYVVLMSLSVYTTLAVVSVSGLLPSLGTLTSANYYNLLYHEPFAGWLGMTLMLTGISTLSGVAISITSGIALSRMHVPGKRIILYMLLIITMFPMTIMIIPLYFMFHQLGLIHYYGLIVPYSAGAIIFSSWLIKNYVDAIPRDFEEAAQMDGYTASGALFKVLIPMSRPVIALSVLLAFLGPYTDFALADIFISHANHYTLAIGLYYASQGTITINYSVYAAFSVLMGLPIFLLFLAFQKYIVSGFSLATYK
ncbi:MAG: ABC transporter permease subunit [Candidatus Thermoplasmatota archaeon]|jgi:arabinogalactan oligomer/maltooligosaccharide transport system permease protein|nr:ABC transporter permease subunit [Candidatus Thermoplasmatota archaeon]